MRTNLVMTVPLAFGIGMVDSEADRLRVTEYLADTAEGRWDADYRVVARMLIENGFPDAVIRLGHEFDGVYVPWSARGNEKAYVEAFRHVHDVFASESADFRFEWTGMRSTFSRFGPQAYPGDDYVDIVGMDIYYRKPAALTADVWASQYLAELEFHRDFAIAHGKPVGYSEWGVAFYDEPAFIDAMDSWFTSLPADGPGRLVYQSYFNSPRDGYDLNDNPLTRARYAELFGVGVGVPATPSTTVPPPVTTPRVTTPPPVTTPPRVTTPPVTAPPVTAPPVTVPPVTVPPVTVPPRATGPVSIGEVLSLTQADVCTIVGVDVIRTVMGAEPDPRTGTLPESFGPSCIFTGNGGIGVQFHRYGPRGLENLATMQGKVAVDLAVAGRQAVVSEYSAASQQLTVWLESDTDPALVVYAATRDDAVTVAEAVLARMSG
jgi:hypothetical protein